MNFPADYTKTNEEQPMRSMKLLGITSSIWSQAAICLCKLAMFWLSFISSITPVRKCIYNWCW